MQIFSNIFVKLFQIFLILKKKLFLKVVTNQLKNVIIPRKVQVYDHRDNENNSNQSVGDILGSANTENGGGVSSTDSSISPIKTKSEKPRNRA